MKRAQRRTVENDSRAINIQARLQFLQEGPFLFLIHHLWQMLHRHRAKLKCHFTTS